MELSYWQSRWNKGHTGFHMHGGYPALARHWDSLEISGDANVLVPLCGKSDDLDFLSKKTGSVTGVEISGRAVHEFFRERKIDVSKRNSYGFSIYSGHNIELWCGDFFRFPEIHTPSFDLIYDKAALIALPEQMRKRYASKIISLTDLHTQYLLHHFEYDQKEMTGPPFSVSKEEIQFYFESDYNINVLEEAEMDIGRYKKFKDRGLSSYLRERLLFLTPKC